MNDCQIYTAGHTDALSYATEFLKQHDVSVESQPEKSTHLLLPVPSFESNGSIKGGGNLAELLNILPKDITVIGGNLNCPELLEYKKVDLLQNPYYLAENADITAHCAIKLAMAQLPVTLKDCSVLVIGWGRIGKCLGKLLRQLGAQVTVAARKDVDRAMLSALGYRTVDTENLNTSAYRVIFNTAPVMICPCTDGNGLKIDLASNLGLGGSDVIWARGLPNRDAPESSGKLIAQCVLKELKL